MRLSIPDAGNKASVPRYAAIKLVGLGLPLVSALFTIPVLIRLLGNERFGRLTLIWAFVGHSGLFNIGLGRGRALTHQLSMLTAPQGQANLYRLVTTSLAITG